MVLNRKDKRPDANNWWWMLWRPWQFIKTCTTVKIPTPRTRWGFTAGLHQGYRRNILWPSESEDWIQDHVILTAVVTSKLLVVFFFLLYQPWQWEKEKSKGILTDLTTALISMSGGLGLLSTCSHAPYSSSRNCRHEWMSSPLNDTDRSPWASPLLPPARDAKCTRTSSGCGLSSESVVSDSANAGSRLPTTAHTDSSEIWTEYKCLEKSMVRS